MCSLVEITRGALSWEAGLLFYQSNIYSVRSEQINKSDFSAIFRCDLLAYLQSMWYIIVWIVDFEDDGNQKRKDRTMNPNTCMQRICDAFNIGDHAEVKNAIDDLHMWMRGGGFLPTVSEEQLRTFMVMSLRWLDSKDATTARTR